MWLQVAVQPSEVYAWQGEVLPAANGSDAGGTLVLPGRAPTGIVLRPAATNLRDSLQDCDAACREVPGCNTWFFCAEEVGGGGRGQARRARPCPVRRPAAKVKQVVKQQCWCCALRHELPL